MSWRQHAVGRALVPLLALFVPAAAFAVQMARTGAKLAALNGPLARAMARFSCALPLLAMAEHANLAQTQSFHRGLTQATDATRQAEQEEEATKILARWREDFELDDLQRILAEGPALVSGQGRLAQDPAALALVARALFAAGREGTAKNLLLSSLAPTIDRSQIELALAEFALAEDDLGGVLERLYDRQGQRVRYEQYSEAWWLVAEAFARLGESKQADPLLEHLVTFAPQASMVPSAYHLLAQHALARGDLERARAWREKSAESAHWQALYRARRLQIRAAPGEPLPRLGLAQLWLAVENPEQARAVLLELLQIDQQHAPALALLGECERHLEHFDAALAAWDQALHLDPGHIPARFNRAILARLEGRLEQARADFLYILEHGAHDKLRHDRAKAELQSLDGK